ncbi:MAG: hypothetical protein QXD13_01835 [Candidatus Pacearchaeota archaeon]
MKKTGAFFISLAFIALSLAVVSAAGEKISIQTEESFAAGKQISINVALYDSSNKLINAQVSIILEDALKTKYILQTIESNKLSFIDLGENAPAGIWTIKAEYASPSGEIIKTLTTITIESSELVKFEIKDNSLIITNIGNTKYAKEVYIAIDDSVYTKHVELEVGESVSYKLAAPEGNHNIKITDGKNTLIKNDVSLTGNVIGVFDERTFTKNPLTSGIDVNGNSDKNISQVLISSTVVYVFLIVLFGSATLLIIERKYRRMAAQKYAENA